MLRHGFDLTQLDWHPIHEEVIATVGQNRETGERVIRRRGARTTVVNRVATNVGAALSPQRPLRTAKTPSDS